jgi:heme A synthase
MSIRIYWMERMMGGETAAVDETVIISRVAKNNEKKSALMDKIKPVIESARRYVYPAASLTGLVLLGLAVTSWTRRRARYVFPDFDVEPRLGGAHAAGVGAVISFASAAIPPASQRDQVPDYLRRA